MSKIYDCVLLWVWSWMMDCFVKCLFGSGKSDPLLILIEKEYKYSITTDSEQWTTIFIRLFSIKNLVTEKKKCVWFPVNQTRFKVIRKKVKEEKKRLIHHHLFPSLIVEKSHPLSVILGALYSVLLFQDPKVCNSFYEWPSLFRHIIFFALHFEEKNKRKKTGWRRTTCLAHKMRMSTNKERERQVVLFIRIILWNTLIPTGEKKIEIELK